METTIRALMPALAALLGVLALSGRHGRGVVAERDGTMARRARRSSPRARRTTRSRSRSPRTPRRFADRRSSTSRADRPYSQRTSSGAPGHVDIKRGTCGRATRIAVGPGRRITITTACPRRKASSFSTTGRRPRDRGGRIHLPCAHEVVQGRAQVEVQAARPPEAADRPGPRRPRGLALRRRDRRGDDRRRVRRHGPGGRRLREQRVPVCGTSASLKSTDPKATLPGPYTYVQTDAAQHVFEGVILRTAGTQRVTATDSKGLTMQSTPIEVAPASGAASYWPSAFAAWLKAPDRAGRSLDDRRDGLVRVVGEAQERRRPPARRFPGRGAASRSTRPSSRVVHVVEADREVEHLAGLISVSDSNSSSSVRTSREGDGRPRRPSRHRLAHGEVVEGHRDVQIQVIVLLVRELDVEADRDATALLRARLAPSITPGSSSVTTANPASASFLATSRAAS